MHDKAINTHFAPTLLAAALAVASGQAMALPTGQSVNSGSAIFAPGTNSTAVTVSTVRTVISWSGFEVAANETVSFNQNTLGTGGTADILNLVQSGATTNILGAVTADVGIRVYIVNPNGFVLNAPGAGTLIGDTRATAVASSINFSNVSVQPNAFNLQGGDMMLSLQHTVPQVSNVSSMSGVTIPAAAAVSVPSGANVVNGGGNSQGQDNQAPQVSLQALYAALPQFSTYSAAFSAAQNVALTQLQNTFSQNPSASQKAANAMTQSVPQAMWQTQPQSPVQTATFSAPAPGGLSPRVASFASGGRGMQNFVWGNTLRANARNGVVSLGL